MTRPAVERSALEFLGIGAQKAGTTWLWEMLRRHPHVWMPPLKELHYFDRATSYPSNNFLATDDPWKRLCGREAQHREFRATCAGLFRQAFRQRDREVLRWTMRFASGRYDDEWYASLFARSAAPLRGEITPAYSILDAEDVARVRSLAPGLRIIFLLRNPIDRAWSQVRFDWTRGAFADIDDLQQVQALIDSPRQTLRGDYLRTLELWEAQFPQEQLFVGFYDDISRPPQRLHGEVCRFLGLDPALGQATKQLDRKFNVSQERKMPDEVRRYLVRKYQPDLRRLAARFGGHAARWEQEAAALL